jgi:hypothetical protein
MEWESNMTRDQKEKHVLELYQQGRTIRHIAEIMHMSFSQIGAITKPYKQKIEQESGQVEVDNYEDIKSKSKATQAIKLFSDGKDAVDVVIALDLRPDEVQEIYRQFLKLHNMHELVRVYDKMEDYLPSLWNLYRLMIDRGLNKDDVINLINITKAGQLEYLKRKIQSKMVAESWLDNEIKKKEYHLRTLNKRIREFSYREGDIIPMTNTANEPTYRPDNAYPSLPADTRIKPIPYMWDDMKQ